MNIKERILKSLGLVEQSALDKALQDHKESDARFKASIEQINADYVDGIRETINDVTKIVETFTKVDVNKHQPYGDYVIAVEMSSPLIDYGFHDERQRKMIIRQIGERVVSELERSKFIHLPQSARGTRI